MLEEEPKASHMETRRAQSSLFVNCSLSIISAIVARSSEAAFSHASVGSFIEYFPPRVYLPGKHTSHLDKFFVHRPCIYDKIHGNLHHDFPEDTGHLQMGLHFLIIVFRQKVVLRDDENIDIAVPSRRAIRVAPEQDNLMEVYLRQLFYNCWNIFSPYRFHSLCSSTAGRSLPRHVGELDIRGVYFL